MKKTILTVTVAALGLLLAACGGTKLTTSKTTYGATGMVAVVKGNVSGTKQLTYHVADQSAKKANLSNDSFAISIPLSNKTQKVTLTANSGSNKVTKTVTVKATQALGNYSSIVKTYNNAVIGMALPTKTQKLIQTAQAAAAKAKAAGTKTPTAAEIAQMPAAERVKVTAELKAAQATQTEIETAMKKATTDTKDQQLPAKAKTGIHDLVASKNYTIRGNVANGKLIAATMIVPTRVMKNSKTGQKDFGVAFSLLSTAVGAKPKVVMKAFTKALKNESSSQTTIKTIKSNGVKYDVGVSTTKLYIYITK